MSRIYRKSDRLKIKIDDLQFVISPLSLHEKTEVQQLMVEAQSKGNIGKLTKSICKTIQYSLKDINGLYDCDDQPYKLSFDDSGMLTDECLDELMNLELSDRLQQVCVRLLGGIPKEFLDDNGNPIEGVSWDKEGGSEAPKP